MIQRQAVTIAVPATTANLGPGFDCLGLALGLHSRVTLSHAQEDDFTVEVVGEGSDRLPHDSSNPIARAVIAAMKEAGYHPPAGLHLACDNRIPVSSGLGSSAAAIVAGIAAANSLMGELLDADRALSLAVALEGHPDNVAPALLGGLVISSMADKALITRRIDLPPLDVVICLPDITVSTSEMRAVLPSEIPFRDAAANVGRTALVVEALRVGDYDLLAKVMVDRMHIPYRQKLVPGYAAVEAAAKAAGAAAVTLSGAGPAMAAFAPANHFAIAEAMRGAFNEAGLLARSWVLPVDGRGAAILPADQ